MEQTAHFDHKPWAAWVLGCKLSGGGRGKSPSVRQCGTLTEPHGGEEEPGEWLVIWFSLLTDQDYTGGYAGYFLAALNSALLTRLSKCTALMLYLD